MAASSSALPARSGEWEPAPPRPRLRPVPPPGPGRSRRRRRPNARAADALAALAGLGLGLTIGLTAIVESTGSLSAPGGLETALGRLTGMVGAYAMLVMVLLVARIPVLERVAGQDRLVAWHRRVAPWPLLLIAAHGVLITLGYAAPTHTGALHEIGTLLLHYPGVLAGTAGFGLLAAAGVTSYRHVRRRMAYETWWVVHLYTYLALGLSFSHQVLTGAAFVGHPAVRAWWTLLWLATAGVALVYRVLWPLVRSVRHGLRVVAVEPDAPGVVSVVLAGRALDRLPVDGGQFLNWRFLVRGLWWHAHPYSISAMPRRDRIRITVRDLGDHSAALARVRPGTRVAIEGPYGAFTRHARETDRVLLVGAGVGVTPLRALLEDLPAFIDVTMIVRAHAAGDLVLRDEVRALVQRRDGRLHELLGPRSEVRLDARALRRLVPDLARRDVYVCGPDGFTDAIRRAAATAGVPSDRIHHESFAF